MTSEAFDVVILGGGNAGIGVTGPARRAGLSVAMIEQDVLGGTCPNRGCTPKKVLVAAGHALHAIECASVHKISVGKAKLDWPALIAREKDLIKDIPANLARAMAHRKVDVIKGQAAFVARIRSASATASSRPNTSSSRRDRSRDRCRFRAPNT